MHDIFFKIYRHNVYIYSSHVYALITRWKRKLVDKFYDLRFLRSSCQLQLLLQKAIRDRVEFFCTCALRFIFHLNFFIVLAVKSGLEQRRSALQRCASCPRASFRLNWLNNSIFFAVVTGEWHFCRSFFFLEMDDGMLWHVVFFNTNRTDYFEINYTRICIYNTGGGGIKNSIKNCSM